MMLLLSVTSPVNDGRLAAAADIKPAAPQPAPSNLSQYVEEFSALMSATQQMSPPPKPPQISPQPLECTFPIDQYALSAAANVLSYKN